MLPCVYGKQRYDQDVLYILRSVMEYEVHRTSLLGSPEKVTDPQLHGFQKHVFTIAEAVKLQTVLAG